MKKYILRLFGIIAIGSSAWATNFQINSLDRSGKIIFTEPTNAGSYYVEWAPTPNGPWTNSWDQLKYIPSKGSGKIITNSIPMFFRVVAIEKANMVLIPAGTNSGTNPMANGESAKSYYPATYSLTVTNFYMDATAVTKAMWDNVYQWGIAHGYSFGNPGLGVAANHPVHSINWYDAVKWCNARSEREGLEPCYTVSNQVYKAGEFSPDVDTSKTGYRLATIVEWEYAARGGLVNMRFPNGNTISHTTANYKSDSTTYSYDLGPESGYHPAYTVFPYTSPVRSFPPNGYGLYDMNGNMRTWCWDPKYTNARKVRGGVSFHDVDIARCGRDGHDSSTVVRYTIGIRCVRRAP